MKFRMKIRLGLLGAALFTVSVSFSQKMLLYEDVYNFEIGDEFHFISPIHNQPSPIYRHIITDKWYSPNKDTVFYKRAYDNYTAYLISPQNVGYHFYRGTDTAFYTDLKSPVYASYTNLHNAFGDSLVYDSIVDSLEYCGRLVNGYDYIVKNGGFEDPSYKLHYAEGLGRVLYYRWDDAIASEYIIRLFYYRKGNDSCGTPDLFTGIQKREFEKVKVYPNPVQSTLHVDGKFHEQIQYQIFNPMGQSVLNGKLINQGIDLANLPAGVYFLQLSDSKNTYQTQFFKE